MNESILNSFEAIKLSPQLYLSTYFSNLRNQIDIEAQTLLNCLHESKNESQVYSNQADMIDKIDRLEQECLMKISKSVDLDLLDGKELFGNKTILFVNKDRLDYTYSETQFGKIVCIEDEFFSEKELKAIGFSFKVDASCALTDSNQFVRLVILASILQSAPSTEDIMHLRLNFSEQTTLSLQNTFLESLTHNAFNGLVNLKWLDISFNRLAKIDDDLFKGLNRLTAIDISRNQRLTELSTSTFKGLVDLERLSLAFVQISVVRTGTFEGLVGLKEIDLSHNYSLTELEVDVFSGLNSLVELNLSNCELTCLDRSMFKGLTKLNSLNLAGNQLENLYANTFSDLDSLTTLDLSSNLFKTLEASLFQGLATLTHVNISNNRLKVISPDLFTGLFSLERLLLSDNRLTRIERRIFEGMGDLEVIDLSFNRLTSIHTKILRGLVCLKVFKINDNFIQNIDSEGLFEGLTGLSEIDLENNRFLH